MDDTTARLALPLLAAGQAQKEMTHNEALTLIDLAVLPVVETAPLNTPPASPVAGLCWLAGTAPTAAWQGRAGAVAGWTAGGWRFVPAREGMRVRVRDVARDAIYAAGAWAIDPAPVTIAAPTGGTTTDSQARTAIAAILTALRGRGIVA